MYLVNNIDQIHQLFNKSKKCIFLLIIVTEESNIVFYRLRIYYE